MEEQRIEIRIPDRKTRERIDTFLTRETSFSRNRIQKLIKEGLITVDGECVKQRDSVRPGQVITLRIPRPPQPILEPEAIPIDIVYEDAFLLVVNKASGMVVHPAFGHRTGTLVHALLHHTALSATDSPDRPGIVHRLDKDTSGLLVVAKNERIHGRLADQFAEKSTERLYTAVVWGHPSRRSGTVESNLARSFKDRRKIVVAKEGKRAVTHFEVVERFPLTSLLRLRLETGRTHQIRVHLSHMGHPVFGDQAYGGRGARLGGLNQRETALAVSLLEIMPRQALHAKTLGFRHPETGEFVRFDSEIPKDMRDLIERLKMEKALERR